MKRTLLALTLALAMVLLAACGGGSAGPAIKKETVKEPLYTALVPEDCDVENLNTEVNGYRVTGKIYGYDDEGIFFMLLYGDYTDMYASMNITTDMVEEMSLSSALKGTGIFDIGDSSKGKLGDVDAYVFPIDEVYDEDAKGYGLGFITDDGHMILMAYAAKPNSFNDADYKEFVDGFTWIGETSNTPVTPNTGNSSGSMEMERLTRDYVSAMVPKGADSQTQVVESSGYEIPCEFVAAAPDSQSYYMMIYSDYGDMIDGLAQEHNMEEEAVVAMSAKATISGVLTGMGRFEMGEAASGKMGNRNAFVYPLTSMDGASVEGEARGFMDDDGESLIIIYCAKTGSYSADAAKELFDIRWDD